jgi:hypothetical protein
MSWKDRADKRAIDQKQYLYKWYTASGNILLVATHIFRSAEYILFKVLFWRQWRILRDRSFVQKAELPHS